MTVAKAIQLRPGRIARALIAANRDDTELVIYTAGNISFKEKQLLLQRVKEARTQYCNRYGYDL